MTLEEEWSNLYWWALRTNRLLFARDMYLNARVNVCGCFQTPFHHAKRRLNMPMSHYFIWLASGDLHIHDGVGITGIGIAKKRFPA